MRLPNGYGSVYKLSGNRRKPWVARKTVGWTFDQEKQKSFPVYKFIGYYASSKEALTALSDYNKDPYDLQTVNLTFRDVFEKWSDNHTTTVSKSSMTEYNKAFRVCEPLHDLKFTEIKLDHLQDFVDQSGKNEPTLKKVKSLLSMMWEYAVIHEIITPDKNRIRYLNIKKGNPNKVARGIFTTDQINTLWESLESNEDFGIILIMIYTGVRISELLDLKKDDVHLQERWFYIRESKTEAGVREVPIAEKIVPIMDRWIRKDSEYLICSPQGKHIRYQKFHEKHWVPALEGLGFNHTPHDTRHTCVSMLTTAGVDERIIKKIVGHKGSGVTEAVYTHVELQVKLEAINKI